MAQGYEGYPNGWFVVAYSDDLGVGDVRPMKYFGTELVAFRGQDGQVRVLDGHCSHMGAHLGHGGRVIDDTIECPFHAWCFVGSGACVTIPYAKKIPVKARQRAWRVREVNGMVFVHHDRHGREPTWDIPVVEEYASDQWTPWKQSTMEIKTHPREIVENVADKAHFPRVHNTKVEQFENEFRDHLAIQRTHGEAYPKAGGVDRFFIEATYHGPAYQFSRMDGILKSVMVNAHTPIDEHSLHLRYAVSIKRFGDDEKADKFAAMYAENLRLGFGEDVQIWENKCWREVPVFCDGDGPIGKLRKWYKAFYD